LIADGPTAAAGEAQAIADKVALFIAAARVAAVGGLTWSEFSQLMAALVRLVASTLDTVSDLAGAEKRQMVLEAVGFLFDAIATRAVPLPLYPLWAIVRPSVRSLMIAVAAGLLEQLLPLIRVAK
jgi:hypothetical protein